MMSERKVWIVKENEFVNLLSGKARASRAAMLSDYFIAEGCTVTAWSSLWSHNAKAFVSDDRTRILLKKGLTLNVIPAKKSYTKNISFARIAQEREIQQLFRKAIEKEDKPDLIYCCWPLIETSYEAVKYGKKHGIPVVIDIRDMWPDIFVQPFPKAVQRLAKVAVDCVFRKKSEFALQNATMVTSTIPKAMELAKEYGRQPWQTDHPVFHCYKQPSYSEAELGKALAGWARLGVDDSTFNVIFFGTIGKRIPDFDTVLSAAERLQGMAIKFIFCGLGDDYERVSGIANGLTNVVMAGLRNQLDLVSLSSISQIGLIPYRNTIDFQDSLPTKFSEYLSSGLIVMTSLSGLSRQILEENKCGFHYEDAESLASAIARLANDSGLASVMRKHSYELYRKSFDADVVYSDFVRKLLELEVDSDSGG